MYEETVTKSFKEKKKEKKREASDSYKEVLGREKFLVREILHVKSQVAQHGPLF